MGKRYTCKELNARLRETIKKGKSAVISSAGDGFTARLEEKGGLDAIVIVNSARFRHIGAGSMSGVLPVGNANQMVLDYAEEVCAIVKETPVIAGFCAQDTRTVWEKYCSDLTSIGVSGFFNFPTVGLVDAGTHYRKNLEESGLGYSKEIEVLKLIKDMGYFTIGYCFTPEEAKMIAKTGSDIVACHVGLTAGGLIGAGTISSMDETIKSVNAMINAAKEARPQLDFLPFAHGGIMEDPKNSAVVLKATEAVGYIGGSSIERTPVEPVVIKVCQDFKNMPVNIPGWMKL